MSLSITCVYRSVVLTSACPISSCSTRMLVPFSNMVVLDLDSFDMVLQFANKGLGKNSASPLVPFAEDVNPFAVEIDILDPQSHAFHETKAGTVKQFGHKGMCAIDMPEKAHDFLTAKHGGQAGLPFGTNWLDFILERLIKHLTIKKDKGVEGLPLG